ncbi:hypothetical protein GCM10027089_57910 [Nocardia thraciensis]
MGTENPVSGVTTSFDTKDGDHPAGTGRSSTNTVTGISFEFTGLVHRARDLTDIRRTACNMARPACVPAPTPTKVPSTPSTTRDQSAQHALNYPRS